MRTLWAMTLGLVALFVVQNSEAQSCAVHGFPIPTHYNGVTKSFSEGAVDPVVLGPGTGDRIYADGRLPNYQNYIGQNYTVVTWPNADACAWAQTMSTATGYPVYFRKPTSYSNYATAKLALTSGTNAFQILPNLVFGSCMATLVVPPGWLATAPAGTYPIIASGAYDTKQTMSEGALVALPAIADAMRRNPNHKAISLFWNGCGDVGSRTADSASMFNFNVGMLQVASVTFGGDRMRVFLEGSSRGGLTALRASTWTSTTRVRAAFASVPVTAIGDVANLTNATTPALYSAAEWSIGLYAPWRAGWTYANGHANLLGMTQNQAHLYILTGTADAATANQSYASPRSNSSITTLASGGTNIFLQVSSHDYIAPWIDQFRYLKALAAGGVKYKAVVNYLAGHHRDPAVIRTAMGDALTRLYTNPTSDVLTSLGTVERRIVGTATTSFQPAGTADLFTIEFPRILSPSITGSINATGRPGTIFQIDYTQPASPMATYEGSLGSDGTVVTPFELLVGITTINAIRIKLPGTTVWKTISLSRSSSLVTSKTIERLSADPATSSSGVSSMLVNSYLGTTQQYANQGCLPVGRCKYVSWGFIESP